MEKPEVLFITEVRNDHNHDFYLLDRGGWVLARLLPGQRTTVHSTKPYENVYARFSSVTKRGDGTVEAKINPNWKPNPAWEGKRTIDLINNGPNATEVMRVDGEPVDLYAGLIRTVTVSLNDWQCVWFSRIEIVETEIQEPDPSRPEYLVTKKIIERKKTLRPEPELRAIKKEMQELMARRGMHNLHLPQEVKFLEEKDESASPAIPTEVKTEIEKEIDNV